MKIKKALLLMTETSDQTVLCDVVQFCKKFRAKLFVLFIMDGNKVSRLSRLTHQKLESIQKNLEEEGWQILYLTEDEAVQHGVWTSLHFEEGSVVTVLKKFIAMYKIDTLILKKKDECQKVFVSSPVPVIGL